MNVALVFAGGSGERMNTKSKPKQFLELHGKPIIIYTLEIFQAHDAVDAICISCIGSYINYLKELLNKFSITKVRWVVAGGETGQASIYNGLKAIADDCDKNTVILVHDGVRPLITQELITANIDSVLRNGNAISVAIATETQVQIDEKSIIVSVSDRAVSGVAKAPQSFRLEDILAAHEKARDDNKLDFIDSATMLRHYGAVLHTVESAQDNIKITTPSDFYVFRAIEEAKENSQIFGI